MLTFGVSTQSNGYGFENLVLQNVAGNGTGQQGAAIYAEYTNATTVPTWIRIRNLNIEISSGADEWGHGIRLEGGTAASQPLRNVWINNSRIQIGANGSAGIRLVNVANAHVEQTLLNGTNGNLEVTGSAGALSSSVDILGGGGTTLALDFAENVRVTGGTWTTLTTTANTTTTAAFPGLITNTPSIPTGTSVVIGAVMSALARYAVFTPSGEAVEFRTNAIWGRNGTQFNIGTLDNFAMGLVANSTTQWFVQPSGVLQSNGSTFLALPSPGNGSIIYCSDCTIANPCAGGGTGAIAKRLNGVWVCN